MSGLHFEQNTSKGVFYAVITLEEVHRIMNIDTHAVLLPLKESGNSFKML